LLDFCSSPWLCPRNSCVTIPADHFGQFSVTVCLFSLGNAVSLGLSYTVHSAGKLVSAQSLITTIEDFVSGRSHRVSGSWQVLAASAYPDNDY